MLKFLRNVFNGKKERRRIPSNRRKVVWYRDGKRCRYCRTKTQYHIFHLDHIKPVSSGGNDYNFNLCLSCPKCNLKKGAKPWIKPKPLPFWRKIYGIILIVFYLDIPTIEDFV